MLNLVRVLLLKLGNLSFIYLKFKKNPNTKIEFTLIFDISMFFRRPMRSSKTKAMDQVKQWCGSMKDEENERTLKEPTKT